MIKGSVLNSCQNVLLSTRSSSNSSTMIEKSVQDVLKVLVLNKISALSSYSIIIIIIIKICLKILSKFLAFFAMVMWVALSSTAVIIIKLVFLVISSLYPCQIMSPPSKATPWRCWWPTCWQNLFRSHPFLRKHSLKMDVALSSTAVIIIKSVFLAMASLPPLAHFVSPSWSNSLKMWVVPSSTAIITIKSVWDCNTSQTN